MNAYLFTVLAYVIVAVLLVGYGLNVAMAAAKLRRRRPVR